MNWKQRYKQNYRKRPEVKARMKAYMDEYKNRPEVKARVAAIASLKSWLGQYERLLFMYELKKGDLPKWQLLRLGALSECFRKEFEKPNEKRIMMIKTEVI